MTNMVASLGTQGGCFTIYPTVIGLQDGSCGLGERSDDINGRRQIVVELNNRRQTHHRRGLRPWCRDGFDEIETNGDDQVGRIEYRTLKRSVREQAGANRAVGIHESGSLIRTQHGRTEPDKDLGKFRRRRSFHADNHDRAFSLADQIDRGGYSCR